MKKVILAVLLLMMSVWAWADGFAKNTDFAALVIKNKMPRPLAELRQNPDAPGQQYVQLRGSVKTIKDNSICLQDGSNYYWVNMPAGTDMEDLEEEDVAIIASFDKNALLSLSGFVCHVWTYRFPLESYEKAAAEKAAQQAAPYKPTGLNFAKAPTVRPDGSVQNLIDAVSKIIRNTNKSLTQNEVDAYTYSILQNCSKYEVHPLLVCAVITEESRFRANATSRAGARGLGQLMPGTARGMGITNLYDPMQSIYGCVRYIRSLQDRLCGKSFGELTWGDLSLILSGYNAGPTRVKKAGGIPPIKETQNYVVKVTNTYKKYLNLSL